MLLLLGLLLTLPILQLKVQSRSLNISTFKKAGICPAFFGACPVRWTAQPLQRHTLEL